MVLGERIWITLILRRNGIVRVGIPGVIVGHVHVVIIVRFIVIHGVVVIVITVVVVFSNFFNSI